MNNPLEPWEKYVGSWNTDNEFSKSITLTGLEHSTLIMKVNRIGSLEQIFDLCRCNPEVTDKEDETNVVVNPWFPTISRQRHLIGKNFKYITSDSSHVPNFWCYSEDHPKHRYDLIIWDK